MNTELANTVLKLLEAKVIDRNEARQLLGLEATIVPQGLSFAATQQAVKSKWYGTTEEEVYKKYNATIGKGCDYCRNSMHLAIGKGIKCPICEAPWGQQ